MREDNINNLIKKYKSGTSSLEEEQFLFDNLDKLDSDIKATAVFVKVNRKEVPGNLNEKLWDSFDEKKKNPNKFKYHFIAIAASIALLFTLFISNQKGSKQSYSDKVALLNEAKSMFKDTKESLTIHNIIIESDLIALYTKTTIPKQILTN